MDLKRAISTLSIVAITAIVAGCGSEKPSTPAFDDAVAESVAATLAARDAIDATIAARVAGTIEALAPTASVPGPTPEQMQNSGLVDEGRRLFTGTLGCSACHALPGISDADLGPDLSNIGSIAAQRRTGYTAEEYIYEAIKSPEAFIVEEDGKNYRGIMSSGLTSSLSEVDIQALTTFLLQQKTPNTTVGVSTAVPTPPGSAAPTPTPIAVRPPVTETISTTRVNFEKISHAASPFLALAFSESGRIFFTGLRSGEIGEMDQDGKVIRTIQVLPIAGGSEQGMLGIAVDPDYETNGYLYVYHTYVSDRTPFNRLIRITDREGSEIQIDTLLDGVAGSDLHNAGSVVIGTDGTLFVSTGDAEDPDTAQDLDSLNGKILRLNLDGSIPDDNPFEDSPVYAYGFRNPFGLGFDRLSETLYVTENGPECCDEFNAASPGNNYGWPIAKGLNNPLPEHKPPLFVWDRTVAPTIPAVITTNKLGEGYEGSVLIGAFNTGDILLFRKTSGGEFADPVIIATLPDRPVGIFEHPDGTVYVTTIDRPGLYVIEGLHDANVTRVDIQQPNHESALGDGCHGLEAMGGPLSQYRWASGDVTIEFGEMEPVANAIVRVIGFAALNVIENESTTVTATLNGVELGQVELRSRSETPTEGCTLSNCRHFVLEFEVDRTVFEENETPILSLNFDSFFVPSEVYDGSTDTRELAVRIHLIELVQDLGSNG